MAGYTKNVAILKGLKDGFSADGGALSGLIKCEKYGATLRVEAVLINFAPLSEGRYVLAVSDGAHTRVFEGVEYEGVDEVDTSEGFAALVCYVKEGVFPIASAICGNFHSAALGIKAEIERLEGSTPKNEKKPAVAADEQASSQKTVYEDEALAEDNYYEYAKTDESGGALRQNQEKEEDGLKSQQNEKNTGSFTPPLARGECFFERMKSEIENVLSKFPHERGLEETVENSQWVKITYGDGKFYVFGIISDETSPQYICYGVPAEKKTPPESMRGLASLIPTADGGFWVMYQDAFTGASLKVDVE